MMPTAGTATPRRSVLLDFGDDEEITQWMAVNDVVMGGMSVSAFEPAGPGIARFRGTVSLENSGGFASVRTSPRRWNSSGASAFVLRVLGDGHAYKFTVRTDDGFDGVQYQSRFTPPAGAWYEARLPVESFAATFRGRIVPGSRPLDPARVRALGLMISDKQAGPFELLVDWIGVETG
jgi:NADH dehydrogenase [ubiquinone] 1 alpha subcomplex assembly factor 1